jgi:hypothetical protein
VLHVSLWLPVTVLGAYYMWRSQWSVGQIRRELAQDDGAANPDDATQAPA